MLYCKAELFSLLMMVIADASTRCAKLGVEKVVTDLPSHSEPCMRLSPHTAPSLTVPLLRIQLDFFVVNLVLSCLTDDVKLDDLRLPSVADLSS